MTINLEQIVRLMKKTGDKFIVNAEGENFVILPIDQYERMIDVQAGNKLTHELTEDELIERINDEIAQWRMTQNSEKELNSYISKNDLKNGNEKQAENEDEDEYYLEPVE